VKKFPAFYRRPRLSTVSTTACHWSNTCSNKPVIWDTLLVTSHLRLGLTSKLFTSVPQQNTALPRPAPLIFSILSPAQHLVSSTNHAASHYTASSSLLSPRPSQSQTPPSAPHSRTPSAYVLALRWETNFDTQTKQNANYSSVCCNVWTVRHSAPTCLSSVQFRLLWISVISVVHVVPKYQNFAELSEHPVAILLLSHRRSVVTCLATLRRNYRNSQ